MYRPKCLQDRIIHRLRISSGHLKKVLQMTEGNAYCIDILHQSQALRKALEETENLILENHLKSCVTEDIKKGNDQKAITEVMNIFKKRPK